MSGGKLHERSPQHAIATAVHLYPSKIFGVGPVASAQPVSVSSAQPRFSGIRLDSENNHPAHRLHIQENREGGGAGSITSAWGQQRKCHVLERILKYIDGSAFRMSRE